jgi:hypothetical protein
VSVVQRTSPGIAGRRQSGAVAVAAVRDLAVLVLHLLATVARLAGPGGARSVVAESVLLKHQLLILNRSRQRSPNLGVSDRLVAGVCALFMRPKRLRLALTACARLARTGKPNSAAGAISSALNPVSAMVAKTRPVESHGTNSAPLDSYD